MELSEDLSGRRQFNDLIAEVKYIKDRQAGGESGKQLAKV
jgi:hypothetical protein